MKLACGGLKFGIAGQAWSGHGERGALQRLNRRSDPEGVQRVMSSKSQHRGQEQREDAVTPSFVTDGRC